MKQSSGLTIAIALAGVVFAALGCVGIWTDWLWFESIGRQAVFIKVLVTEVKVGVAAGGALLAFLVANLLLADRLSRVGYLKTGERTIELPGAETMGRQSVAGAFAFIVIVTLMTGLEAAGHWDQYLSFVNATAFGVKDPVFGRDVSFYVFGMPFLNFLYRNAMSAVTMGFVVSLFVYMMKRGFVITGKWIYFKPSFYVHLSLLGCVLFLVRAAGYVLMIYGMMYTSRGYLAGPGYVDVHVRVPLMWWLAGASVAAAVICAANSFFRSWKLPAVAVGLVVALSGVGAVAPAMYQALRVKPNELAMEQPYIKHQIDMTRAAYGIDQVDERPFDADGTIDARALADNQLTIKNIRLWDAKPLLQTYQQLQEIRPYYKFDKVDVDRYTIDGELRQVMVSARELSQEDLPSRAWINEHLSFTHGFGAVMSPVNKSTGEGMPDFFIRDIPPVSTAGIAVTRPQIYFGELAGDYVFTNTRSKEFDYPIGNKNHFDTYRGDGGVVIDSILKKAAFALRFSSLTMLLNTDITTTSRIQMYRNITGTGTSAGRVEKLMPMLAYDTDPYLVIDSKGRMKWIIDAYTLSSNYPYAARSKSASSSFNYLRNPVKAVVDAYDGTISYYVFDDSDPIVRTYMKIFPGLLRPRSEMPADLQAHARYPQTLFNVQSEIYMTYHMREPQVFYNKEDQWTRPNEIFYQDKTRVEPYYTIMRLPGVDKEEFVLLMPFTPVGKDNISAWMCARSDGDRYGQLLVYRFPKKRLIYGPLQIEARIDQDPEISRQFTLWSQKGSQIIRGNMLVVPIAGSLLYVEPIFLKAEKGEIPELKRVIVSSGDKVVMAESIDEALAALFGTDFSSEDDTPSQPQTAAGNKEAAATSLSPSEAIRIGLEHLEKAKDKLRGMDWQGFGRELDSLEKTLRKGGGKD